MACACCHICTCGACAVLFGTHVWVAFAYRPTCPKRPFAGTPPLPSHRPRATFDIDEASLERRYKLLQWTLHPDKAVTRSPQERGFSAEHAAHINQAYGVLRRPLSRANYLVSVTQRLLSHHVRSRRLLSHHMRSRQVGAQLAGCC